MAVLRILVVWTDLKRGCLAVFRRIAFSLCHVQPEGSAEGEDDEEEDVPEELSPKRQSMSKLRSRGVRGV